VKKLFIISLILIGLIDKPKALLTDYRDPYIGSYFCNKICEALDSAHTGHVMSNDTITITVAKDDLDSVLNIFVNLSTFKVKLRDEVLYSYQPGTRISGKFFSSDSISFGTSQGHMINICAYRGKKN
jgi:hypothetical protein